MNTTENNPNHVTDRNANTAGLLIRATIILAGFMVMLKICKVMVHDLKDMGLK